MGACAGRENSGIRKCVLIHGIGMVFDGLSHTPGVEFVNQFSAIVCFKSIDFTMLMIRAINQHGEIN